MSRISAFGQTSIWIERRPMIISSIIGACDMPWRSRRDAARRRCAAAHRQQTAGSITMYKSMSARAKRELPLTPSALGFKRLVETEVRNAVINKLF